MLEKLQFMTIMFVSDLKAKKSERGATATEYGLLVAFIAIAIIAMVTLFGGALSDFFEALAGEVATWTALV